MILLAFFLMAADPPEPKPVVAPVRYHRHYRHHRRHHREEKKKVPLPLDRPLPAPSEQDQVPSFDQLWRDRITDPKESK